MTEPHNASAVLFKPKIKIVVPGLGTGDLIHKFQLMFVMNICSMFLIKIS